MVHLQCICAIFKVALSLDFSFLISSIDDPVNMVRSNWRSSTTFVIVVVCVAVFTDIFLYGLIVPVMPFLLSQRVGVPDHEVQFWTSALLATYGASILLGSCESLYITPL